MRALPRRALLAAPVAVPAFVLTACGGSDSGSGSGSSSDTATQQQSQSTGGAEAAGEADGERDDKPEPPLTGDIETKAEGSGPRRVPRHGH